MIYRQFAIFVTALSMVAVAAMPTPFNSGHPVARANPAADGESKGQPAIKHLTLRQILNLSSIERTLLTGNKNVQIGDHPNTWFIVRNLLWSLTSYRRGTLRLINRINAGKTKKQRLALIRKEIRKAEAKVRLIQRDIDRMSEAHDKKYKDKLPSAEARRDHEAIDEAVKQRDRQYDAIKFLKSWEQRPEVVID